MDPHAERICLRGVTDFSTAHFDRPSSPLQLAAWTRVGVQPRRGSGRSLLASAERSAEVRDLTGHLRQRFQADEKERIVRERGYVNLELNYEDVAEFSYAARQVRPAVSGSGSAQEYQQDEGRTRSVRRDPLLLLHHDPHGSQQPRKWSGAPTSAATKNIIEQLKNGVNALRVPLYASAMGLHGHRRPGLEYQVVVRPDDAPKEAAHPHASSGASSTASS